MNRFLYTGSKTNEISFPLGGLGTGCIGLAGNGRLIDWEIFNRPAKGSVNGFSHFAIRAECRGQVVDARVLHGDLHPPYSGSLQAPDFASFGFGPRREYLTGLPHFSQVEFRGEFPVAALKFKERRSPCFWSLNSGWGEFEMKPGQAEIRLLKGSLKLRQLNLPRFKSNQIISVTLAGKRVKFEHHRGTITFDRPAHLKAGQRLRVRTGK